MNINIFRDNLKSVTFRQRHGTHTNVHIFIGVREQTHSASTTHIYIKCVFVCLVRVFTYHTHRSSAYNLIVCNILMKVREHLNEWVAKHTKHSKWCGRKNRVAALHEMLSHTKRM